MAPLKDRLISSSILHCEFIKLNVIGRDSVINFLNEGFEDEHMERHFKLARSLWTLAVKENNAGEISSVFNNELVNGTPKSLALVGELFIEIQSSEFQIDNQDIDRFFKALRCASLIKHDLSKAKFYLNMFFVNGDRYAYESAIKNLKLASREGNLTAAIVYVGLLEHKPSSGSLRGILNRCTFLLNSIFIFGFSVLASVGKDYVDKWWRYPEVYQWLPKRVHNIDLKIYNKEVSW